MATSMVSGSAAPPSREPGAAPLRGARGWDLRAYLRNGGRSDIAIVVLVAALIATIWIIVLERVSHERGDAIQHAHEQNSNLAIALEEHTVRTLKGVEQALGQLAREYREHGRLDLSELVEEGTIDADIFQSLAVIDDRGYVVASIRSESLGAFLGSRDYFATHRVSPATRMLVGPVVTGQLTGKPAIQMSRRVTKADGSFGGVAYAAVNPSYFIDFYQKAQLGREGLVSLVGVDGFSRARRAGSLASFGQDLTGSNLMRAWQFDPMGNIETRGVLEGVPRLTSYRTLSDYPLIVAVGTSRDEVLAGVEVRRRGYLGGAWLSSAVLVILGALLAAALRRQRAALRQLGQSESQFRVTFNEAAAGIVLTSLDGRVIDANHVFCRELGYERTELLGLPLAAFVDPGELPSSLFDRSRLLSGEATGVTREVCYLRRDGTRGWANRSVAMVRGQDGEPWHFVSVLQDVSAIRATQQELEFTNTMLTTLQGLSPDAMLLVDRDMRIVSFNRQFASMWGLSPEILQAGDDRPVLEAVANQMADPALFLERVRHLYEHREEAGYDELRTRDGRMIDRHSAPMLGNDARYVGRAWFFRDVTERRRAESRMVDLQTRLQAALSGGNVGLWDWDLLTDKVFYSSVWKAQLGYAEGEIDDELLVWEKLCHPDDLKAAHAAIERCLADPAAFYQIEFRMKHKSGAWRWMLSQATIQRTAEGLPTRMVGCHIDITERKRIEERQRLSDKVISSIADGVVITDGQRRIVFVNAAFSRVTGYAPDEVLGQTPAVLRSGRQDDKFYQEMWREIDATGHWQGEIWNRRKNGEIYPELLSISAVRNGGAKISNYVGVFNDISAFKKYEERLAHQAQYDALTDLPNRLLLTDRLNVALSQAQRSGKRIALLFLDLDRFKNVNDSLGHNAGDILLCEAAGRLKACMRAADTISRQGGDEFLMVLPEIGSDQDAARVAEKLIAAISRPFALGGTEVVLTGSVGIACFPENGGDPETLIRNADAAMYSAKSAGRNRYQFYTEDMNKRVRDRLLLESELRQAMDREELFLVYQPQVDLGTGAVVGLEALVRWKHPVRGVVPPAEFIGVAEESGLIAPIGKWVLETACRQHAAWIADGLIRGTIAVNVSAHQFRQSEFLQIVADALSRSGLQAENLEVEVTESMMMQGIEGVLLKLNSLHKLGVKIAIDDFGTGYSSLSYLKQFPIYRLKVDQSFTRGLPEDRGSGAIAQAVISMGHSLGLNVLAEGVETEAQAEHLRSLWCDVGQGYLYARPFPAKECGEYLRRHAESAQTIAETAGA